MKLVKLDVNETYRATGDLPAVVPGEDPIWFLDEEDRREHVIRCTSECVLMVYPSKDSELGNLQASTHNVREVLTRGAWFRGMFKTNLRGGYPELHRPIPTRSPEPLQKPRPLTDGDVLQVATVLEWIFERALSRDAVHAVIESVARENAYDPVADWLNRLQWDGEPRIEQWLQKVYGAEDSEFTQAVGSKWLVSAVARALDPGCQVDTCLVLFGGQGVGKTTGLRALSQGWYVEGIGDMHSKDSIMELQQGWIVELAELAAAMKSEQEQIKLFLSRPIDTYRPPYGKLTIQSPRRQVFAATTNDPGFLKDATGSRRFWCVDVSRPVMSADDVVVWIRDAAPQMWAEAVQWYRDGVPWHLNSQVAEQARIAAEGFREELPWESDIRRVLTEHEHRGLSLEEVWREAVADSSAKRSEFAGAVRRDVIHTLKAVGEKRYPNGSRTRRWFAKRA